MVFNTFILPKNVISFEMINFFFFSSSKFLLLSVDGSFQFLCVAQQNVGGTPIDEITLKDSFYAIQDKKDEEVSRSG